MTNDKIKKALYNIDKWMPEDFELQREYYQLINDKDQKGMEEFLDMYADQDRLMRYGIQYEDLGKLSEAIISGSNYAKGGEMSDKKTILKIQNMMDDERMTLKLQKQFEGKDLFDNEIVDEYDVKQFDYKEDSDKIEKFIRMKKNKFYVVPFDNQDDSYYYILVPKDKMAKGGEIVAQKTFDINDNEVSEDIYEFLLDYTSDDFELSEEDQYAIRSEDPETVIDIMNEYLTDYEVVSRYDDDLIRLKIQKKISMAKGGRTKDSQITPFQRANQIAEDHFGEFGLATLEHDDFSKVIVMSKANKLAKQYGKSSFMLLDESDMETILNDNPDLLKDNYEDGGYMSKGGKTKTNPAKFRDKVNAITKKLAGTKVPKKYKKDYGATYDKKEANTAAKRIAGAKLAEVRAKLAKKKK
jgi:hypothetical protein